MSQNSNQPHQKPFLKRILTGHWITLGASLLFLVAFFLPWLTRNTYFVNLEFSLTDALDGEVSDMNEVVNPGSAQFSGADLVDVPSLGPEFINLSIVTLITTILCFALVWPVFFVKKHGLKLTFGIAQLVLSIIGWVPFFYLGSILRFFERASTQQFPEEPFRRSTYSYGLYLAGLAAVGLTIGAWVTLRNLGKQRRLQKALRSIEDLKKKKEMPEG